MSKPKHKVGDLVTIDIGWECVVPRKVTLAEVLANHGRQGVHRYFGSGESGEHGFYEDQILVEGRALYTRADWEAPL